MSHERSRRSSRLRTVGIVVLFVGCLLAVSIPAAADHNVTEDEYVETAPEPGDEYFEAEASDGRWVSYANPRDEYRSPYVGDSSGKICVMLLNEAGDPIVGETIPETTVTIPTGDTLAWHSKAAPMTVQYPLTEQYERPLDADQFGTTAELPQGDGYMDSHCIEFHGLSETDQISYGQAEISGTHADRVDLVGYVQQQGTWDSERDPVEAATSYEEAGGGWTFNESESHGQVTVVLQLAADQPTSAVEGTDESPSNGTDSQPASNSESTETTDKSLSDTIDSQRSSAEFIGLGILLTLVVLVATVIAIKQ